MDISHFKNYVYRTNQISPSYIYHAELGIDTYYLDFHERAIEWVFTGRTIYLGQNSRREARNGNGHSTCTASKAAGRIYGASKAATLVIVKMPDYTEASIGGILGTVIDHIEANHRGGQSVISISWGSRDPIPPMSRGGWRELQEYVGRLGMKLRVPIVVAAGNSALQFDKQGRQRQSLDTAPAIYTRGRDWVIAVGNCNNRGIRVPNSQTEEFRYQIHAPGVDVACPNGGIYSGTSYCKFHILLHRPNTLRSAIDMLTNGKKLRLW